MRGFLAIGARVCCKCLQMTVGFGFGYLRLEERGVGLWAPRLRLAGFSSGSPAMLVLCLNDAVRAVVLLVS